MKNRNANYWQNKIAAYLNESVVKIFDIENREHYAKAIQESFGTLTSTADEKKIQQAQYIASGLTRAALPFDDSKLDEIILKHPLVKNTSVSFSIKDINVQNLVNEIKQKLETELAYFTKDLDERKNIAGFLTIFSSHTTKCSEKKMSVDSVHFGTSFLPIQECQTILCGIILA